MLYLQLFLTFFKIGLFGFGGGYAIAALIQNEVVDVNGWITVADFTDIMGSKRKRKAGSPHEPGRSIENSKIAVIPNLFRDL